MKQLLKKRAAKIKEVLQGLTIDNYESKIDSIEEDYLPDLILKLHKAIAYDAGEQQLEQFNPVKSENWKQEVDKWARKIGGERIVSMTGSLKSEMLLWVKMAIQGADSLGVEDITKHIKKEVSAKWSSVKTWQVRRIVHTETLAAASVGQFQSVQSMGVKTTKTWSVTGNNTRDQHRAMEGVTVDDDELFILPNGDQMMYPRDMEHGASVENIVNCACGVIYNVKR